MLRSSRLRAGHETRCVGSCRRAFATVIFEYIEVFHNRRRRHSSLGMLKPIEYELTNFNTATQAA
jgi:putative transposase